MSPNARIPLSILDLAPVSAGSSAVDALRDSTLLAQEAERLGYHRFWMAEHHGSVTFASSATSVLLAHIASHTESIRVGSGGVMLPNHAPLMVAEHYGTLATLYGDRIDLGLGRAPGTDPVTAAALQRGSGDLRDFATDVADLVTLLGDREAPGRDGLRVRALPGEGTHVPLWMLGSSLGGAQVAAVLGLPFSFASHFAPDAIEQAFEVYRSGFSAEAHTAQISEPHVMAGVNVICAPTTEEATHLATTARAMRTRIMSGRSAPLDPPGEDMLQDLRGASPLRMPQRSSALETSFTAIGTPEEVVTQLDTLVDRYDLDELIVTTYTWDPQLRRRSYELLADAWGLTPR
ncbi:LLM class flavin-dependent oxidoreductase [Mobilicoccus caccae]|uniref:Alkane 1-monooxygenase n=1 Tax=Mobilicoccus caccae TaxID=1859295 RepID=A0ABQ6IUS7_9MICO|nr:LLM class flavin-dependent oxidoreductase [Mobilicoccus caccae]GMA41181.1 alkane 1-monooxygenase [Mobilicoccus caccae]